MGVPTHAHLYIWAIKLMIINNLSGAPLNGLEKAASCSRHKEHYEGIRKFVLSGHAYPRGMDWQSGPAWFDQ